MDCSYIAGSEETDFSWRLTLAGVPFYKTGIPRQLPPSRNSSRFVPPAATLSDLPCAPLATFQDQGMCGPSLKFSVFAVLKAIPMVCFSPSQRAKGLAQLGGNLGAIQGIIISHFPAPKRQLMNNR